MCAGYIEALVKVFERCQISLSGFVVTEIHFHKQTVASVEMQCSFCLLGSSLKLHYSTHMRNTRSHIQDQNPLTVSHMAM